MGRDGVGASCELARRHGCCWRWEMGDEVRAWVESLLACGLDHDCYRENAYEASFVIMPHEAV